MSGLDVRILAGGEADPQTEAAIREAVSRVLTAKERTQPRRVVSGWMLAARLEAVGSMAVRSRAALPPA